MSCMLMSGLRRSAKRLTIVLGAYATEAGASRVLIPTTKAEYTRAVQTAGEIVTLTDCSKLGILWKSTFEPPCRCGPCRAIAPVIDKLSKEFRQVTFLKIDIDNEHFLQIAKDMEVMSVPTFIFRNGEEVVDRCIGADPTRISGAVRKL